MISQRTYDTTMLSEITPEVYFLELSIPSYYTASMRFSYGLFSSAYETLSSPKSLSFHPTNQLKPSQFVGTRSILIIHDIKKGELQGLNSHIYYASSGRYRSCPQLRERRVGRAGHVHSL